MRDHEIRDEISRPSSQIMTKGTTIPPSYTREKFFVSLHTH